MPGLKRKRRSLPHERRKRVPVDPRPRRIVAAKSPEIRGPKKRAAQGVRPRGRAKRSGERVLGGVF